MVATIITRAAEPGQLTGREGRGPPTPGTRPYAALRRGRWIISDQSGRQPQFLVGTQAAETW
jgi:hypothetical protein